jgi:hypothetical protein
MKIINLKAVQLIAKISKIKILHKYLSELMMIDLEFIDFNKFLFKSHLQKYISSSKDFIFVKISNFSFFQDKYFFLYFFYKHQV